MKKFALFFSSFIFFFSHSLKAQILDDFPKNQEFYSGGLEKLYEKIHQISIDENLLPCDNKKEIYHAKILLTKDGNIKFIKDFDSLSIKKNKCAYDFTLKILKGLKNDKNWQPAKIDGKPYDAIVRLFFVPNHIFNFKKNYTPYQYYIPPSYIGGYEKQQKDIQDNFKAIFSDFHVNGSMFLDFVVDENGEIINPIITPTIDNNEFVSRMKQTLKRLNQKWKPAQMDGVPIKARLSIPLTFSVNFKER